MNAHTSTYLTSDTLRGLPLLRKPLLLSSSLPNNCSLSSRKSNHVSSHVCSVIYLSRRTNLSLPGTVSSSVSHQVFMLVSYLSMSESRSERNETQREKSRPLDNIGKERLSHMARPSVIQAFPKLLGTCQDQPYQPTTLLYY